MADIISRAFHNGKFTAASAHLLPYFNTHFPLPQNQSWQEYQLPTELTSQVISCLCGEHLPMAQLLRQQTTDRNTGGIGPTTQPSVTAIPSSLMSPTLRETLLLGVSLLGSGQVTTAETVKSKFKESLMHSRPYQRPSNWLKNKVRSTGTKAAIP